MAILETIAAANAAYKIISDCVKNGKEVAGLTSEVGKFLQAEEELNEAHKKYLANPLTKGLGKDAQDWAYFQQLEDIQEMRKELESFTRLHGRPGSWDRWVKYQADARIARKEARKRQERERQERNEIIILIVCAIAGAAAMGGLFWWIGVATGKW